MMLMMNKQKLTILAATVLAVLLQPAMLLAADATEIYDARLEGFYDGQTVKSFALPGGSSLVWIIMIVLTAICVGVMFKHARRTHLD
jgi:hypothetical protein